MIFTTKKLPNDIDSLIGPGTRVEGNVIFRGRLRLDGSVRGNVSALSDQPGTLVVGEKGRIEGEVQAPHVVVNGTIDGQLKRTETLQLQPNARVKGEVHYASIEMQRGAIVEGRLVHNTDAEATTVRFKLASGG